MMEEESGAVVEAAPANNIIKTVISLVILALISVGLFFWWQKTRPAAENSTAAKTEEKTVEKKEEEAPSNSIKFSPEALKRAGIETVEVSSQSLGQILTATGHLAMNEDAAVRVGTFVDGRVVHIFAKVGDTVRKGQTLVHIHSHELTDARANVAKAKASIVEREKALAFAQAEADRAERLFTAKAIAKREVDQANAHVVAIKAETELIKAELERASEFLEHLAVDQDAPDEVAIRSTLSGVVTKRLVTEGSVVSDASDLIEISNASTLWAIAEVPEANAAFVRIGQSVAIKVPSLGDATISGKVIHIGAALNPETRTMQVRCLVNNSRGNLLAASAGSPAKAILICTNSAISAALNWVCSFNGNATFSATLSPLNKAPPWNIMAQRWRNRWASASSSRAISSPKTRIRPAVTGANISIARNSVDFPQPLAPAIANTSPRCMLRLMSS